MKSEKPLCHIDLGSTWYLDVTLICLLKQQSLIESTANAILKVLQNIFQIIHIKLKLPIMAALIKPEDIENWIITS